MKKIFLVSILAIVFPLSVVQAMSDSASYSSSDASYWEQKKIEQQNKSTQMRKEYYEKYKAKWYDVSLITADLLDGSKTDESKFWEVLKKVQNLKEIPERKAYIEKLVSYGADASIFTEEIIQNSGKFWELVKSIEPELKAKQNEQMYLEQKKKEESKYKEELKKKEQELKYKEEKKTIETPKNNAIGDRIVKLFITRLEKVPADKLPATLNTLEVNIQKQLEIAKTKNSKVLITRLTTMLNIVQEKKSSQDDESLIDTLFGN